MESRWLKSFCNRKAISLQTIKYLLSERDEEKTRTMCFAIQLQECWRQMWFRLELLRFYYCFYDKWRQLRYFVAFFFYHTFLCIYFLHITELTHSKGGRNTQTEERKREEKHEMTVEKGRWQFKIITRTQRNRSQ